jgi:hypothetical protein
LETSGPTPNQAIAIDSLTFLRDPFPVVNAADFLNLGIDLNTRLTVFLMNLQLTQGESASSVVINLVDSNGQRYTVPAEDVRPVPKLAFTQVIFRLPDNIRAGTCTMTVKAHNEVSNQGTFRIRQ